MTENTAAETPKEVDLSHMKCAVDGAMTAIMIVDLDFVIRYVNASTEKLLSKHEGTLRELFPGFEARKAVGTCIDIFHKDPSHQRRLLADLRNLPYQTDIHVGPLIFQINVSAVLDEKGVHAGFTLEWSDVTEDRKREREVARLQSAIEGLETNLMMADADGQIVYANPAVVSMLERREAELQRLFPGFRARDLVGRNYDDFHKNPAHQRRVLGENGTFPAKAEINLGDVSFTVNATLIKGPKGERIGNAVEWNDITAQKEAEFAINELIEKAIQGQLDARLSPENFEGFLEGLARGINRLLDTVVEPVRSAHNVIEGLSQGDLTRRMEGEYAGEFLTLKDAINGSMDSLTSMVGEIRESTTQINDTSTNMMSSTTTLSQRTEEQAASLQETAASMEELTSTVQQNTDNSVKASELASEASGQADTGGEVVERAVTSMAGISEASKKIADIIGVIDEIAFQTNLLALNAAVEAARAGEQGRGFAVVAAEVRNLAQRSASAAKEIKSLINDSVERVREGSTLVNESGKTLKEIVGSVKKVSDLVADIAAASREQTSGIQEVNRAVAQMDQVTQQNQAMVSESTSMSQGLDSLASGLMDLISNFRLDQREVAPSRRVVSPVGQGRAPTARPMAPTAGTTTAPTGPRGLSDDAGDPEWREF